MAKQKRFGLLVVTFILSMAVFSVWAMTGPHYWVYHNEVAGTGENACITCHVPHQAKGLRLYKTNTDSYFDTTQSYFETLCLYCHRVGHVVANEVVEGNGIHTPGHTFIDIYTKFDSSYASDPNAGINPVDRAGKTLLFSDEPRVPCYYCHDPHGGDFADYPMPDRDHNNEILIVGGGPGYIPRHQDYIMSYYIDEIPGARNSLTIYGQTVNISDNTRIPTAIDAHNYFVDFVGEDRKGGNAVEIFFPYSGSAKFPEISNGEYGTLPRQKRDDGAAVCIACHNGSRQIAGITVAEAPVGPILTEYGVMAILEHNPDRGGPGVYTDWEEINCVGCHNFDSPAKVLCDGCHGFPPNKEDSQNDHDGAVGAHATHVFGETLSCQNCHYQKPPDGNFNIHNGSHIDDGTDWNDNVPVPNATNPKDVAKYVDIGFPTQYDTVDSTEQVFFGNATSVFDAYDSMYGRTDTLPVVRNSFARGTTMSNGIKDGEAGPLSISKYYDSTTKTCYIGCHNPIIFDTSNEVGNLDNAAYWPIDNNIPGYSIAGSDTIPLYDATQFCYDCHDMQGEQLDKNNPYYLTRHPNDRSFGVEKSRADCEQCHQGHRWIQRSGSGPNNWVPILSVSGSGNPGDDTTHIHTHLEGISYFIDPQRTEFPDPSSFPTSYDASPDYYIFDTSDASYDSSMFTQGFCVECHYPPEENDSEIYFGSVDAPGRIRTHTNENPVFINSSQHAFTAGCLDCHRHHASENLSLIRREIDYPGVDTTAIFLDSTGADSFDGGADGICVVCHYDEDGAGTVNVHHHDGAGKHADTPGGTGHYNYDNEDCTSGCHMHDTGFMPDCNRCHRFPPVYPPEGQTDRMSNNYVGGNNESEYSVSQGAVGAHITHVFGEGYKCDMCHYDNKHAEFKLDSPDDWDRAIRDGSITEFVDVAFDTSYYLSLDDTTETFLYYFSTNVLQFEYDTTFDTIALYDTSYYDTTGTIRPMTIELSHLPGGTMVTNGVRVVDLPSEADGRYYNYDSSIVGFGTLVKTNRTCYVGCHNPIIGEEYETPNCDNPALWPDEGPEPITPGMLPGYDRRLYSQITCVDCHDQQRDKFMDTSTYLSQHPIYIQLDSSASEIIKARETCTMCHEDHLWIEKYDTTGLTWVLYDSTIDPEYKKHTHTEGVVVLVDGNEVWVPDPSGIAQDANHQQYRPNDPNKHNIYYGRSFYDTTQTAPADFCVECHNDLKERTGGSPNSALKTIPISDGATAGTATAPNLDMELYYYSGGHGKDSTAVTAHTLQLPCLRCHNYHGSIGASLLDTTGNEVCYECHNEVMDNGFYGGRAQFDSSLHALSPNSYDTSRDSTSAGFCINCHNPHGAGDSTYFDSATPPPHITGGYPGGYPNMLTYYEEKVCYRCHNERAPDWDTTTTTNTNIEAAFGNPIPNYSTHDVDDDVQAIVQDHIECINCHNPHLVKSQTEYVSDPSDPSVGLTISNATEARDFCFRCHGNAGLPPINPGGELPKQPLFPATDTLTDFNKEAWYQTSGHGLDSTLSIDSPKLPLNIACYQSNLDTTGTFTGCHTPHGGPNAKLIDGETIYPTTDTLLGRMDTPEEMNAMCLSACHQSSSSHTYTLWNENTFDPSKMNDGRPTSQVLLPFQDGSSTGIREFDEVYTDDTYTPSSGELIQIRKHQVNIPEYAFDSSAPGYGDSSPDTYDTTSNTFHHPSASWIPYDVGIIFAPDDDDFDVEHAKNYLPDSTADGGLSFFRKRSSESGSLDPADTTARGVYDPATPTSRNYFICVTCHDPHGSGSGAAHPGMTHDEWRTYATLCNKCHKFTAPTQ